MELFSLVGKIAVNNSEANEAINETTQKASSAGDKIKAGIGKIGEWGAAIGTTAFAAGTAAIVTASNFDDAFAQVNTLLSGSEEEIEAYKEAVLQASSESGVATDEYCNALYNAISAGQSQADAIAFTNKALKLSKGGFTEASTAVDVLTTALNAYGLESEQATSISDMLVTTQNLGKTTVDELASSMGKIIPTANAYGVQIDDICGMYATMTSNGIATADSTTYMNAMLNEFGKSGTTVDGILREMTGHIKEGGLSFSEMMEKEWEMTDVLSLLDEYAYDAGLSMMDLFSSSEAAKAASSLWDHATQLNDAVEAMGNSAGTTEEAYATMTDTISYKTELLKTNFQNIIIQLGESLVPVAEKLMNFIMDNMPRIDEMFNKFAPVLEQFFDKILPQLFDVADQILPVVFDILESLLPVFSDLCANLLPVLMDIIIKVVPFAMAIAEKILPVIVDLIYRLLPILDPILKLLDPILNLVMTILNPLLDLINSILPPLCDWFVRLADNALAPLGDYIDWLCGVWENMFKAISNIMKNLVSAVKDPVNSILGFINGLIRGVTSGVNGIIRALNRFQINVPDWITSLTGVSTFGFNLAEITAPQIPLLAKGGEVEGTAIVGEDGAELLQTNGSKTRVTPLNDNNNAFTELNQKLDAIISLLGNGFGVYLDSSDLVGQLAPAMDTALGNITIGRSRGR